MSNQLQLLGTKRFLPLFITQFLGAFNDNILKNALIIFITYKIAEEKGLNSQILVTLVGALFILPFFLFSALAGQIVDKFNKAKIARLIKGIEIILMSAAAYGFYTKNLSLLMVTLFSMGTHSAFFGPVKYGILPELLKKNELVAGNGLISSVTFISILLGTIAGGFLIMQENGVLILSIIMVLCAIIGFISSIFIPENHTKNQLSINFNIFTQSIAILKQAKENRRIFLSIIGLSWFWFVGATFLTQFPSFAKDIIHGNHEIVTLLLTIFSIGIAIGSLICNRILQGHVTAIYVPLATIFISIFAIDLYFASSSLRLLDNELLTITQFLTTPKYYRILLDLIGVAICGGIYIVPLYSIIQIESKDKFRARIIAALNIVDSGFMVLSSIFTIALLKLHFTIPEIFLALSLVNFAVAVYVCDLLPDALPKSLLQWFFKTFYKVKINGIENYRNVTGNAVIIANHTSFLDAAIIASFLPDRFVFAVNTEIAKKWYLKPFFKLADILPIDPTNPMAAKTMIHLVREGKKLVIFPEGRITMTGALMKIYAGPAVIAEKSNANIIPIRIDGAQYSTSSRLKGRVRTKTFPQITLTILPARKLTLTEEMPARQKREILATKLYDMMVEMVFETSSHHATIFQSLIDAAKINGFDHSIIEDFTFKPLNYRALITKSFALGGEIAKLTQPKEFVGVMLPNSNSTAVTFFALQAFSRVPTMLNFSAGVNNLLLSAKAADLKHIITSRKFIEVSRMEAIIESFEKEGYKISYLEDIAKAIPGYKKIAALLLSFTSETYYKIINKKYLDENLPCVVLFTSGSEGTPKGVVLSHANIQANRCQLGSKIDFGPKDIVFNALPMFHSFGLTGATLLPVLNGVKTFFYPSPLHYKIVPELVYSTNATMLFGTNTFLSGYAKYAHAYDFYSLRYVFAGAEKVFEETRKAWNEKFGIRILEGYGATETSPIISVNTPMENKSGTVGKLLPGITAKLVEMEGILEGKKLVVQGPNIMLGYLFVDKPGQLQKTKNHEYDTGDVVDIDSDGFIHIKGRAKRFAKIAGEIVSLTAVESSISKLWPGFVSAVTNIPDEKKGEQIILITNKENAEREEILRFFKANGLTELMVPKSIIYKEKVPLLGTGKIDYVKVKEVALEEKS